VPWVALSKPPVAMPRFRFGFFPFLWRIQKRSAFTSRLRRCLETSRPAKPTSSLRLHSIARNPNVLGGENKGRDIHHVAVAESISKVGTVEKGKNFDRGVLVKVKSTPDPANLRLIAFVQESDAGEVVGASLLIGGLLTTNDERPASASTPPAP